MKLSEFVAQCRDELHMGWTQGAWRSGQNVCAVGALDRVAMRNLQNGGVQCHRPAEQALLEQAREMFPEVANMFGLPSIPSYNDKSGRTKQDMENLFDKTVIGLEEKGL